MGDDGTDRVGSAVGRVVGGSVSGLRGGGRGWLLLVVASGWLFMNGFRIVLPVLLPGIKAEFAIGNAEAGFALTVLWLLYAGLQFPAGLVADRTGERPLLLLGALLAAASFAAFYVVPSFALFLLVCAAFGVAAGLFGTPRDMLVSRTFPAADNTAYGVVFAGGSFGAAVLPVLAALVATHSDWRTAVVWLLPLVLLVAIGLVRIAPPPVVGGRERPPVVETLRRTLGALAGPRLLLASVVFLLFVFTFQGLLSFLPTYLVEQKGLSQGRTAALFGLVFVVAAVLQPLGGTVADRYGDRLTFPAIALLATALLAALPFVDGVLGLSLLVPLMGVRLMLGPLVVAFVVRELPSTIQGTGLGLVRTLVFGLGASASTIVGVFGDAGLFDASFLVLAGLTGVMGVVWLLLPPATAS